MPVPAVRQPPPAPPAPSPFWAAPGVMSQTGYTQSLGNWDAPGGLKQFMQEWGNTGTGHGIQNPDGSSASYEQVLQDLANNRGLDITGLRPTMDNPALANDMAGTDVQNPYSGLFQQYMDLGNKNAADTGSVFSHLQDELARGRVDNQANAAQRRAGVVSAYDQGATDINGIGNLLRNRLSQEATAMGLKQALGGNANMQNEDTLARIQAMQTGAKAGSLANFDTLAGVHSNVLNDRGDIASMLGSSSQAAALENARHRYGLGDPNDLYGELVSGQNQALLAKQAADLQKQQLDLQTQQFLAQQAAGAGGGSSGGGGGRRSSGGGSSSGTVGTDIPNVTVQELSDLVDRGPTSRVDPGTPGFAGPAPYIPSVSATPTKDVITRRISKGKPTPY